MFSKSNNRRETVMPAKTTSAVPSILSPDLKVIGNILSTGEIQLDGTVEGNMDAHALVIGESAQVRGNVTAQTLRVAGSIVGTIRAKEVFLSRTARVNGDVHHEILSIEAGARLEGACHLLTALVEASEAPEGSNRLLLTQQEEAI